MLANLKGNTEVYHNIQSLISADDYCREVIHYINVIINVNKSRLTIQYIVMFEDIISSIRDEQQGNIMISIQSNMMHIFVICLMVWLTWFFLMTLPNRMFSCFFYIRKNTFVHLKQMWCKLSIIYSLYTVLSL